MRILTELCVMNRVPKKKRLERLSRMIESSLGSGCLTMNVLHLAWLAALRIHSVTVCRLLRAFTAAQIGGKAAELSFGVSGFRGAAHKIFSLLFYSGRGGAVFEKIRTSTSCVYVGTDGAAVAFAGLQFAGCRLQVAGCRFDVASTGWSKPATYSDLMK